MAEQTGAVGALTDGTGVSPMTMTKFIKDFVADFLMTAAAALVAVNVVSVPTDTATAGIAVTAILGAAIRAGYRAVLRWATEP